MRLEDNLNTPEYSERIRLINSFSNRVQSMDQTLLMHAYVGCFSLEETIRFLRDNFFEKSPVREAFVRRILRFGLSLTESRDAVEFFERLVLDCERDYKSNRKIDAFLYRSYGVLPIFIRGEILSRWRHSGRKENISRWAKAVATDSELRMSKEIADFWIETKDDKLAVLLIDYGDGELNCEVIKELVSKTGEGWIAARALVKSSCNCAEAWRVAAERFPSSYLYASSKVGNVIEDKIARDLIEKALEFWPDGDYGLAVWSVGQMGKWNLVRWASELIELKEKKRKIDLSNMLIS